MHRTRSDGAFVICTMAWVHKGREGGGVGWKLFAATMNILLQYLGKGKHSSPGATRLHMYIRCYRPSKQHTQPHSGATLYAVMAAGNKTHSQPRYELLYHPGIPGRGEFIRLVLEAAGVSVVPATLEPDVKSALTKVELGEVDAALVYRTDVVAAGDAVEGVEIGGDDAPTTAYEAARLRDSADPALADAFVDYVLSADGRSVLADAGFTVG